MPRRGRGRRRVGPVPGLPLAAVRRPRPRAVQPASRSHDVHPVDGGLASPPSARRSASCPTDTLVARAPLVSFSFVYMWGSLWMGQVNLFTLAGLLLAFGVRSDRLAGFGLALAIVDPGAPGRVRRRVPDSTGDGGPWLDRPVRRAVRAHPAVGLGRVRRDPPRGGGPADAAGPGADVARAVAGPVVRDRARRRGHRRDLGRSCSETACSWPGRPSGSRSCSCRPTRGTTGSRSRSRRCSCLATPARGAAARSSCSSSFVPADRRPVLGRRPAHAGGDAGGLGRNLRDAWPLVRPKPVGILGPP